MIKLIAIGLVFCAVQHSTAQNLQVYVKDSIYTTEPLTFNANDTINGKATYTYTNHNNALAYEVNFYNGYRSGFVKYYYPDGKLMSTCVFQKSKKYGEYTLYDQEGKIVIKGEYVKDVKDGFWIYKKYNFYGNYKNGLKHKKWKYKPSEGKKISLSYKNGILVSKMIIWPPVPQYILKDGVK